MGEYEKIGHVIYHKNGDVSVDPSELLMDHLNTKHFSNVTIISKNPKHDTEVNKCVVKLKTSFWYDNHGCYLKKSITFLRKQCLGKNLLVEDLSCIGAEEVLPRIINLDTCIDGVYSVTVCNKQQDCETGNVDDYDYKLVPYQLPK